MANQAQKFIDSISKQFGDGAANVLGARPPVRAVSTGSLAINYAIGPYCPGFPLGQLSQVFGTEQSGKSLLCCQALAQAQNDGLPVFLVDREMHYTPQWFERFGGDKEKVFDLHPQTVEDCFGMVEAAGEYITDNGLPGGLFVIDSLQSLPTRTMYEDDTGTGEGLSAVARYLSGRLGRYIDKIWTPRLGLIVVGQLRESPSPYAKDRQYTPGGNALKHFSVLRLKMVHKSVIKVKEDGYENRIGFEVKVTTVKNDVGGRAPFKETIVKFYDGTGATDDDALFQIALETGIVTGGAAGYYQCLEKKFRGKDGWPEFLSKNPEVRDSILERAFDPEIVLRNETARVSQSTDDHAVEVEENEDDVMDAVLGTATEEKEE
jgi:recombination protein RecA